MGDRKLVNGKARFIPFTRVKLNFTLCKVSDTGVQALAQALQGLVHLTQVSHVGVARQRSGGGLRPRSRRAPD